MQLLVNVVEGVLEITQMRLVELRLGKRISTSFEIVLGVQVLIFLWWKLAFLNPDCERRVGAALRQRR